MITGFTHGGLVLNTALWGLLLVVTIAAWLPFGQQPVPVRVPTRRTRWLHRIRRALTLFQVYVLVIVGVALYQAWFTPAMGIMRA